MADLLSKPLSLYSIPVAWFIVLLPAGLRTAAIQQTAGFNNVAPRANIQRLSSKEDTPKDLVARVARMDAAHQNGLENLPLWIGAVLAGNFAGLDQSTLNKACVLYIVARGLYNYVYINQRTRFHSLIRTSLFATSSIAPMYLLIQAANKVYATGA